MGELKPMAFTTSISASALEPMVEGVTGVSKPFSLFFPAPESPLSAELGGSAASLLGAGVIRLAASVVAFFSSGFGVIGLASPFLWKKPKMLRCWLPLLDWPVEEVSFFFGGRLGVEISFPSIPRAIV
jgi:hypothetical protein